MTGVLAKIANVKKIIVTTPRDKGNLNPAVMYAAKKCGVTEVITCGGAQAIGSLAYIQQVNKIIELHVTIFPIVWCLSIKIRVSVGYPNSPAFCISF